MKKFKLVSLIILMSMVFSAVVMPLTSKAVDTDKITAENFNMYYLEYMIATFGAGSMSSDVYNKEIERHFVNIEDLKKNGENVIKYNTKTWNSSNDMLDSIDMAVIMSYTEMLRLGEKQEKEWNEMKELLKNNATELGISGDISNMKLSLDVVGNTNKVSYYVSDNGSEAPKTELSVMLNDIVKKLGGTVKELPDEIVIDGKTYNPSWGTNANEIARFYYNLANCAKSTLISYEVNGRKVYLVVGYENDKTAEGVYKTNLYLVTDKNLDPVPDDNKFETELNYEAFIGTKDVGGKTEDGTFMPSYDETNIKEDADVTATISSKNKEEIVKVNDKEVTVTPSKDQPWYYPNPEDKTKVAKQYPFDTYDNSTENGMVSEKVTLTSSDDKTSEQNVSIKWPFRIIDKTYDPETPTDDTTEVTVTIETNLPMDPDKVPQGWTMVPNTDNHKIRKTYKKGEKIDEDVTVYQNKTGNSDKTHVKYTWPGDKTDKSVSDKIISQTGEKVSLALIIAVLAIVAAIVINKKKNNLTK